MQQAAALKNKPFQQIVLLKKTFIQQLKNVYWIEKNLLKVLPKLAKAATTKYLKASFKGHLIATQDHIKRLEEAFTILNEKAGSKKCDEMEGILLEATGVLKSTEKNTLERDLALISAAQNIEHYEIDVYGKLTRISESLGEFSVTLLLEETLTEEKEAEETFNAVKDDTINDDVFKTDNVAINEFEAVEEE